MSLIPLKSERLCFIRCDEMVIEAGLCHCANKFYEADNEAQTS